MEEQEDQENLYREAQKKVELGEELKVALKVFEDIPGVTKVQRKIQQELKFLNKVNRSLYNFLNKSLYFTVFTGYFHKIC